MDNLEKIVKRIESNGHFTEKYVCSLKPYSEVLVISPKGKSTFELFDRDSAVSYNECQKVYFWFEVSCKPGFVGNTFTVRAIDGSNYWYVSYYDIPDHIQHTLFFGEVDINALIEYVLSSTKQILQMERGDVCSNQIQR